MSPRRSSLTGQLLSDHSPPSHLPVQYSQPESRVDRPPDSTKTLAADEPPSVRRCVRRFRAPAHQRMRRMGREGVIALSQNEDPRAGLAGRSAAPACRGGVRMGRVVRVAKGKKEATPSPRRLIVAISGSTGPHYGVRLLEVLRAHTEVETHLILSAAARLTIEYEMHR